MLLRPSTTDDDRPGPAYRPALVVLVLALLLGSLFVASYSLALARPTPREIPTALVTGGGPVDTGLIGRIERGAGSSLALQPYPTEASARKAIKEQRVYAALVTGPNGPHLLVASAAGASVTRVLRQAAGPVPVVDLHPLPAGDPSGLVLFYVTLAATILGFVTVFQLRANALGLSVGAWFGLLIGFSVLNGLLLSVVTGPVLGALAGAFVEKWAVLAMETLTAAAFNSTMVTLIGRWAILPTWVLFIVLGNTSSGGPVAPPLLPPEFAFLSRCLPPGATVSALRNAVYFGDAQQVEPFLVLGGWCGLSCTALAVMWAGYGQAAAQPAS